MRLNEEKSLHLDEENLPTPNPMKELKACNFDELIDKIFEEQSVRKHFFDGDQMFYAALDYSGTFKFVSSSWAKCLGLTEEEIKSIPFSVLLHPDDIAESMDAYEFFSQYGESAYKMFANRYRKLDGSYALIQWFAPFYAEELDLWMFTAYEIPEGHQGINIYNGNYKPFNWVKKEKDDSTES